MSAQPATTMSDWGVLVMGLFGGLALFLYGLDHMTKGLQGFAGPSLKYVLARLTSNRFLGALTGAFVTAVLNSSSVTTVLVVGFITAGLMSLAQSIGVIMGANVGSTITAQIVAFDVTHYALAMIALGFALLWMNRRDRFRELGSMIMGLGMLFFGMGVMGEAMAPLRTYGPFLELMVRMEHPALGILVGAVFTGLIQSSAATTGIVIVLAAQGLVSLEAGIGLALGANIGTCVTALLAAVGKPVKAQRAAAAHVMFNVLGVSIWVGLIPLLADLVVRISPSAPELEGLARRAAEAPRQIANAHTLFNVLNTLLFIGFTGQFARLVTWLVPDRAEPEHELVKPKYLDPELIRTPALALERVRLEVGRLGELVEGSLALMRGESPLRHREIAEGVAELEQRIDRLHEHILRYMGQVRRQQLTDRESEEFLVLMSISDYLEHIGDTVEDNLVECGDKALREGIRPSEMTWRMFAGLHDAVAEALRSAVKCVTESDAEAAADVFSRKKEINGLIRELHNHQAERLALDEPNRPTTFRLEMEVVGSYKRIYTLSRRIAKRATPRVAAPA